MRDITSHPAHRLVVASVPTPVAVAVAVAAALRRNPVHGRGGSRWHPAGAERPGGVHLDAPAARRQARRFTGPSRPGDALSPEPIAAVFPSHSAVVPKHGGLRLAFERLRPCGGAAAVERPALVLSRSRRPSVTLVGRRRVQAMHSTATITAAIDQRPDGCMPAHRLPSDSKSPPCEACWPQPLPHSLDLASSRLFGRRRHPRLHLLNQQRPPPDGGGRCRSCTGM